MLVQCGLAALLLMLTVLNVFSYPLLVLFSMPPLAALLPLTYLNLKFCLTLAGPLYLGVVEDSSWCISGSGRIVLDLLRCQLDYRLLSRSVTPIIYAPLILLKFFFCSSSSRPSSFMPSSCILWNTLPASVISAKSTASFSCQLDFFLWYVFVWSSSLTLSCTYPCLFLFFPQGNSID